MNTPEVLYNAIGSGYNATRQADPYIARKLFEFLDPQTNDLFLDIGCGTGNYAIALAEKGLDFTGVEPSEKMLDIARSKQPDMKWFTGQAENIPVGDSIFDAAIATLTIHHWKNLEKSFNEIARVLKEDGKIVFFTATPMQMEGYWLNHYFPKMLLDSIIQMPSFERIALALDKSGFQFVNTEKYFIQDDLKDCFLYAGKNRPQLYFDEEIRKGISSFSALSNKNEVEQGLASLKEDLVTGKFEEIQEKFKNDGGDYIFITAEKKRLTLPSPKERVIEKREVKVLSFARPQPGWGEQDIGEADKVYIRDAGEGDVEAIAMLMGDLGYPSTSEEMEVKLKNIFPHPDYRVVLAILDGEVVGFSGLMKGFSFERSGTYVRIISFVVKKDIRNKGVGKLLIKASEDWAMELGADNVVISSGNREERMVAHAFYQKLGYVIKSSGFFKAM